MVSIETLDKHLIDLKIAIPQGVESAQWNCYLFAPQVLDLNEDTYPAELFYRHLHNEQYLYTDGNSLNNESLHKKVLTYKQHVYKSPRHYRRSICHIGDKIILAVRSDVEQLIEQNENILDFELVNSLLSNLDKVINGFRTQEPIDDSLRRHFRYIDESINWRSQQILLKLLNQRNSLSPKTATLISEWVTQAENYAIELNYRLRSLQPPDKKMNYRLYQLKDYRNRYRLLDSQRHKRGVLLEQSVFSIAAFLSMAIATTIAFITQQAFGNFTTPFFFVLTFTYIFKDRFKELSRNYILKKIMAHRCQFEYSITDPLDHDLVATMKDGFSFMTQSEIPESIKDVINQTRRLNRNRRENILYYKKRYIMNQREIEHHYHGVKDQIVINIHKMLRNIPKESHTIYTLESGSSSKTKIDKDQIIYMVVSAENDGEVEHQVLTLWVNSKGIVQTMSNNLIND